MPGQAARSLSTPASANQLGEIQRAVWPIFPPGRLGAGTGAWAPRLRQGPWSGTATVPSRQSLWLPAVVQGWLRVRYPGQAELGAFLSFVCVRTDNYMADWLIASEINFSFKKCQLGH